MTSHMETAATCASSSNSGGGSLDPGGSSVGDRVAASRVQGDYGEDDYEDYEEDIEFHHPPETELVPQQQHQHHHHDKSAPSTIPAVTRSQFNNRE